jgi:Calx-beta domain-containing protein/K319-like protein
LTATLTTRGLRAVDAVVHEPTSGTTNVLVPVRLNRSVTRPVSVQYATVDGTANGNDYSPVSGTLVFPVGTTQQNVVVPVKSDVLPEGDETFRVELSAPQNANLDRDLATVTIQDDPTPIANAGPDQNVKPNKTATIDGSGSSDSGGLPLTYLWTQIDGPVATIEDRNAAVTHVTVPGGPEKVTFRLTVTNQVGQRSSDDVTLNIAPK